MGHWGFGYKDSDQHLDRVIGYASQLIDPLKATVQDCKFRDGQPAEEWYITEKVYNDLRSHLMWTFRALEANDEWEAGDEDLQSIYEAATLMLDHLPDEASYTNSAKRRHAIAMEIAELNSWLIERGFEESELDPRLVAILQEGK